MCIRDSLRRVVDYEIAAGERFDGTNVASLSSYNAARHLVVGEMCIRDRTHTFKLGKAMINAKRAEEKARAEAARINAAAEAGKEAKA